MENSLRQKAKKKLLRVTMPSGNVICHKSVTMTFIDVLKEIGSENFDRINLEIGHYPLLSKEIFPKFKDYMKPVVDGWYVNIQSDTDQKYLQLNSIKEELWLAMDIEVGTDFITSDVKVAQKGKKKTDKLLVKFPDGEFVGGENPIDTFLECIWKIGVEEIFRKGLQYKDKPLITTRQQYNSQVQIGKDYWLTIPPQTKDKFKMLRILDAVMRLKLEVSII